MPYFVTSDGGNIDDSQFHHCLTYVKRVFPLESIDVQKKMALAVCSITKEFHDNIIPNQIKSLMTPTLN